MTCMAFDESKRCLYTGGEAEKRVLCEHVSVHVSVHVCVCVMSTRSLHSMTAARVSVKQSLLARFAVALTRRPRSSCKKAILQMISEG